MVRYWFNVFFDPGSTRMPGKGVFLSIANEDEAAAHRNADDVLRMYPGVRRLGLISTTISAEWRKDDGGK